MTFLDIETAFDRESRKMTNKLNISQGNKKFFRDQHELYKKDQRESYICEIIDDLRQGHKPNIIHTVDIIKVTRMLSVLLQRILCCVLQAANISKIILISEIRNWKRKIKVLMQQNLKYCLWDSTAEKSIQKLTKHAQNKWTCTNKRVRIFEKSSFEPSRVLSSSNQILDFTNCQINSKIIGRIIPKVKSCSKRINTKLKRVNAWCKDIRNKYKLLEYCMYRV